MLTFVTATTVLPATAAAEGPSGARACIAAHEDAQRSRAEGHLLHARELLVSCSSTGCPAEVRQDCASLLASVADSTPSVVIAARDRDGHETASVAVHVDGTVVRDRLDGRAISVDPGMRRFHFVFDDGSAADLEVLVREGEKMRPLSVAPPRVEGARPVAPSVPTHDRARAPIPLGAWLLGGGAIVATGAAVYFGSSGRSREHELARSCSPHCDADAVDAVERRYIASDISSGIALACAIAAGVLIVTRGPARPPNAGLGSRQWWWTAHGLVASF